MLRLNKKTIAAIHDHGITCYPFEGCGLLLGRVEGEFNIIEDIFPVPNSWPEEKERTVRFRISDGDMLQAELAAAARDLDIVGIFHSHPDSPPIASPRDLAWAAWPGHSYLITEISQQQPGRSRSWQLKPDRSGFVEETIIVE